MTDAVDPAELFDIDVLCKLNRSCKAVMPEPGAFTAQAD